MLGFMISRYLRRLDPRRSVLCLLAGLMATWAFAGAFGLITGAVPLSPASVERIPLHSPILAGVGLALVVGLPMAVVALTVTDDDTHNAQTTLVAASALIGWILLQLALLREFSWLQPVCLVFAFAVAALGTPPLHDHTDLRPRSELN
ncbi:hypothetical protein ATM97_22120 [Nocardia sp. MH4]|nr:hypothetical protein [Nocardia sp. MH4]